MRLQQAGQSYLTDDWPRLVQKFRIERGGPFVDAMTKLLVGFNQAVAEI